MICFSNSACWVPSGDKFCLNACKNVVHTTSMQAPRSKKHSHSGGPAYPSGQESSCNLSCQRPCMLYAYHLFRSDSWKSSTYDSYDPFWGNALSIPPTRRSTSGVQGFRERIGENRRESERIEVLGSFRLHVFRMFRMFRFWMVLRCFKEVFPWFSHWRGSGWLVQWSTRPLPELSGRRMVTKTTLYNYIIGIHNQSEPKLNRGPGWSNCRPSLFKQANSSHLRKQRQNTNSAKPMPTKIQSTPITVHTTKTI